MLFKPTLPLILLSLVAATVASRERACGNEVPQETVVKMESHFRANKVSHAAAFKSEAKTVSPIPVHFHVVTTKDGAGDLPDSDIQKQIDVLNADFSKVGLSFNVVNTTRTANDDWFHKATIAIDSGVPYQDAMKRALHQGDERTLNVYTLNFTYDQILGYATFPVDYAQKDYLDGVAIWYDSLPYRVPGALGNVMTHEVGHWVGLYHTFQGGCAGAGDEVADTPAERLASHACEEGRDTCTGAGLDPIHNFMDYSYDECRTEFTPGQVARAADQIRTYRGINL